MPTIGFTGSIVSATGDVIYQRVTGTIYIHPEKNLYSWDGEFTIDSGEPAAVFKGFVVTDEGRRGELFFKRGVPGSNTVCFSGTGPHPFDSQ